MEIQQLVLEQVLDKEPTELYYMERTVYKKDENTINSLTFV